MCLVEDLAPAQARASLRALAHSASARRWLERPPRPLPPAGRVALASLLADLGDEELIPTLVAAISAEKEPAVVAALEMALARLESQPPPVLEVSLMGDLAVRHKGVPIADERWHRPIVKRLFAYFALQRGRTVPRDRLLDELWPDEDPRSAAVTFRTVHSRLRSTLEPYLRPKAASRYIQVEGDVYRVDPYNRLRIDIEEFRTTVRRSLAAGEVEDIPTLPAELLETLLAWRPLLPAMPYVEWLVGPREEQRTLYVEGCLYVARAYLIRGELRDAIAWAGRALAEAPWLEEGYQTLMRAHARLGERSLGLKVYADAVAALERELGVRPSPLTTWLADRLRQGEEI
jgi:DNA-binding SARP family transcriptional activator